MVDSKQQADTAFYRLSVDAKRMGPPDQPLDAIAQRLLNINFTNLTVAAVDGQKHVLQTHRPEEVQWKDGVKALVDKGYPRRKLLDTYSEAIASLNLRQTILEEPRGFCEKTAAFVNQHVHDDGLVDLVLQASPRMRRARRMRDHLA